MNKICGYSCEHNKSGVCQISICDKKTYMSDKTEIKHLSQSYYDLHEKYYKQLKDLIDTILNFSLFKEECPLNFEFENNTNEDKSQSIFYEDQWCENNCNDNYKDCWLKYFKKLQKIEQGSDSNE